jgi:hypothetical protein
MLIKLFKTREKVNEQNARIDYRKKLAKEMIITVNIEKHGDIFYLFDKDTDVFIAQGRDLNELKEVCDNKFKRKIMVANDSDLETAGLR